ncbi:MAG: Ig-like domain-containing protein, partial [Actinobacteria bacterium]|nr:Ig-like domain-containing protein [Actinomycetota bacterium]
MTGETVTFSTSQGSISGLAGNAITSSAGGTVTFSDSASTFSCNATVPSSGAGTCSTSSLVASGSPYALTATYASYVYDYPPLNPYDVSKDATTTVASSSPDPSVYGESVAFSATVSSNSPGSGTPTGTVSFTYSSTTLCTATLFSGSGSCTASQSTMQNVPAGSDTIAATYSGDSNYFNSHTTLTQTVNKDATATTITSSVNPSVTGQKVTFTATVVSNSPGSGTPTGTIDFEETTGTTTTTIS